MIFLFIVWMIFTGYVVSDGLANIMFYLKTKMGDDDDYSSSALSWTCAALSFSILTWFLIGLGAWTTVDFFF